ncbi:MAG: ferritin-like domain-containing protein [Candidatus Marsarchaeota archaeon]|nr:ferritin-like domain-containing protein [Candidatus Marsarchaeota archaeon]
MVYDLNATKKDAEKIRSDIMGEQDAIIQYQAHIDESRNEELKEVLTHIMNDEKEHTAELMNLLRKLDKVQDEKFKKEGL